MDQKRGKVIDTTQFDWIGLKVASPERILEWSWGEIKKPETINYRTQRPEKGGLFDEAVFGPASDNECYCGKYKGPRFRGIVCEKCGVEVARAIVRRERMGHIELTSPVAHIWFLRNVPSRIAALLGVSALDAEKVVYFAGYIVTKVHEDERKRVLADLESEFKSKSKSLSSEKAVTELKSVMLAAKTEIERIQTGLVLDEMEYHRFSVKYGTFFEAGIGAEALYSIFKQLDLKVLADKIEKEIEASSDKDRVRKRLTLVKSMIAANIRPEWMFLTRIPVTPPALRPMVALESGRHATSDVNDLYRRVINRNNRLAKLREIHAPEVILRNEKRILQEAVDALLDNSLRRGQAAAGQTGGAQKRTLKSLADYLKSKQGYFRANLLGKRVDYSGRSVIVVGPTLALDECGLPKHMALELFRPFVLSKLMKRELAFNVRAAGRLIEDGIPEVWAILEEVIKDKHVLLNRAPTLHRQGIQAFRPILIEGNAIQLHPLVCPAFNADFDGDQMAVHVPLSDEAQLEAKHVMSSNKNILKPGSGAPVVSTEKEIALGIYWMTRIVPGSLGEGKYFSSPNAAILAFDFNIVDLHAKVWVNPTSGNPKYAAFENRFETSVGRLLFNSILPRDYPYVNDEIKKASLSKIVEDMIARYGLSELPPILDKIKEFGFTFATKSGISFNAADVVVPKEKRAIVESAQEVVRGIMADYAGGLLTEEEKHRMIVEVWQKAIGDIQKHIIPNMSTESSIFTIISSGARGNIGQLSQMAGMKGLMSNTKGEVIAFPVISSMKEGISPIEYFTTTHGARKGLSDTALKTAAAGYLTRRLFDVAQDVVVIGADCGTKKKLTVRKMRSTGIEADLAKLIVGRVLAENVEVEGKTIKKGTLISNEDARAIANTGAASVDVRSPMSCENEHGVCQACYGSDLATRELVDVGEAVGTVAAQAIGEPGTQLTMRTFHTGGSASVGGDITNGLPRVEELFEKRPPKGTAILSHVDGEVIEVKEDGGRRTIVLLPDVGTTKKGDRVEYEVPARRVPIVTVGSKVKKGDALTDGSANLDELFELAGPSVLQAYIIDEVSKIYDLQGASVAHKHMEVIIRQMFSRVRIVDPGDSGLAKSDVSEITLINRKNDELEAAGKNIITYEPMVLGITEVSLHRSSFLSAASFLQTTKILINAATRGSIDTLRGLKENVIIGRLIPAGTGFAGSEKNRIITEFQNERREEMAAIDSTEEVREESTLSR